MSLLNEANELSIMNDSLYSSRNAPLDMLLNFGDVGTSTGFNSLIEGFQDKITSNPKIILVIFKCDTCDMGNQFLIMGYQP